MEQINESLGNLVNKLEGWLNTFIVMLPNILLAALVMGIGLLLTRIIRKYVERIANRFVRHEAVVKLITSITTAIFVILIILLALTILKLDTALKSVLAGAGVAGLAIGLALQDPIVNLFSGVMMSTKRAFEIGDWIETNDHTGRIERITLRSTIIRTPQGEQVLLPNKLIYHNPMKNYSSSGERRVELACGVSYGDDLREVQKIAREAIESNVDFNKSKEVEVFFTEFGDSSINFQLRFWLKKAGWKDYVAARSEAIVHLKEAFDANDIMIPFPIRTLDFGIRGGEPLNEVLGSRSLQLSENREEREAAE